MKSSLNNIVQEGSLCAQHCLNALLQGSYFTPVELASLAQQMDDEERIRMAESGIDTEDYRRFLEQPSGNYDDSGYFSVQVISSALEVWGLELVPYNSTEPRALEAQQCPEAMQAYICNYRDHWFTIRRLGHQWFNLNSLLTGPELLSDTYLAMFLAQLQQEDYSIFVVFGSFPECEADSLLRVVPAVQTVKPKLITKNQNSTNIASSHNKNSEEDLQRAIKLSLGPQDDQIELDSDPEKSLQATLSLSITSASTRDNQQDDDLQKALSLSLRSNDEGASSLSLSSKANAEEDGKDDLKKPLRIEEDDEAELQKALRLSLQGMSPAADEDDIDLERALKMSLECCDGTGSSNGSQGSNSTNGCDSRFSSSSSAGVRSTPNQIDPEDVRRKRLAYLEANARLSASASNSNENMKSQINT